MSVGYKFECGACNTEVAQIFPPELRTIPIETSFAGKVSMETVSLQCCHQCCKALDEELKEQTRKADRERQRVPLRTPEERAAIFGGTPEDYGGTTKEKPRRADGKFAKKQAIDKEPTVAPSTATSATVDRIESKIDKLADSIGALVGVLSGALTNGQSEAAKPKKRNSKVLSRDE